MKPQDQPASPPGLTLEECLVLETAVWEALVDGDKAADEALLSRDFLGVYPTGFATRGEHVGELDDGPTMAEFAIEQGQLRQIANGHVLLSYLARYSPMIDATAGQPAAMYISSLWSWDGTAWINTFSQDTPAAEA